MLVYGDHVRQREPHAALAAVTDLLTESHDALVTAFILASEIAQGVSDAELEVRGVDARSPITDLIMRLLVALGQAIDDSWHGRAPSLAAARRHLAELASRQLPESVRTKCAEGYAFYAVYPESYLLAARRSHLTPDHVVGLRSIGTGLAALVAAATSAPLPATVRPRGDPFRRELDVAPALLDEWLRDRDATFAIVDEGPGLSGSSFGAVADLLESRGIATSQLQCFPSHAGMLGAAASERHRDRWARMQRYVVPADELFRDRFEGWLASLVGPLSEPVIDISAGAWRRRRYAREADWPPSFLQQERLKYLARTRTGTWLARFVGLGEAGQHALELARATSTAGFTPEIAGLCHGFLVERWLEHATTLDPRAFDRDYLIDRIGGYLALRAGRRNSRGASSRELIVMVRRNVTLGISAEAADRVTPRSAPAHLEPVEIDGKLHVWEWLVQSDGTLIKTDAYDHHAAHDLIGCQDIAWDVAGAAIELDLTPDEEQRLAARVGASAHHVAFLRPCYLAFQLGRATLAADASDAGEAARLRAAAARYARLLTPRG